jgi:AcrR family transcriptional regulator
MPPPPAPLVRPARQPRSRATRDRLVRAGLELFAARDFAAVSVAEIAARARVSVGGFYARFRSKDALLDAVTEQVLADAARVLARALAPRRMAGADIATVIGAYVRVMITNFRRHRAAIRMIRRHARQDSAERRAALRRFNEEVHGRLRALLAERHAEIRHAAPDLAVNLGLFLVSAAAREGVLGDALSVYPVRVSDEQLIAELTRAYVAYLTSPAPAARKPR